MEAMTNDKDIPSIDWVKRYADLREVDNMTDSINKIVQEVSVSCEQRIKEKDEEIIRIKLLLEGSVKDSLTIGATLSDWTSEKTKIEKDGLWSKFKTDNNL